MARLQEADAEGCLKIKGAGRNIVNAQSQTADTTSLPDQGLSRGLTNPSRSHDNEIRLKTSNLDVFFF